LVIFTKQYKFQNLTFARLEPVFLQFPKPYLILYGDRYKRILIHDKLKTRRGERMITHILPHLRVGVRNQVADDLPGRR
jgi:hypothetical protein